MVKQSKIDRVGRSYVQGLSNLIACLGDDHLTRFSTDPGTGSVQEATYAPHRAGVVNIATIRKPMSLRAKGGGSLGLGLDLQHGYRVVRILGDTGDPVSSQRSAVLTDWRIEHVFYEYRVLGRTETELLVFHHQPGSEHLGPDCPHIHVSAEIIDRAPNGDTIPYDLDKRHVATGTVTLAAFIRMLIEEFGAEGRGDRQRILDAADARPV